MKDADPSQVFVGCPSGWTDAERQAYGQLLAQAEVPPLEVIPESFAAMVNAKESGELTVNQLKEPALIIDIGSSTTDFTLVKGTDREPLVNFGEDLGAALIDRAIFARMLAEQENRGALEALFAQNPAYRNRCELRCRKAKEQYFANPTQYESQPVVELERLQKGFFFEISLDGPTMRKLLEQPLPELGGRSWKEAFRAAVSAARERLAADGRRVGVVLLTGGASRMDFVKTICEEVFSGSQCKRGKEPECAIADGLARWGRLHVRTNDFVEEVSALIETEVGGIVRKHAPRFREQLVEPLTDGLIEHMMRRGMHDWRDGKVRTLNDLEGHMKRLAASWLKSDDARRRIAAVTAEWLRPIQDELDAKTRPLCQRYGMAADMLSDHMEHHARQEHGAEGYTASKDSNTLMNQIVVTVVTTISERAFMTPSAPGMKLLPREPIISVLGFVVAVLAVSCCSESVEEAIKADIPRWMRRLILSDIRIDNLCVKFRCEMEKRIHNMIESNPELDEKLVQSITMAAKVNLSQRLAEAMILII